jgi:hypothetical protein
MTGEPACKPGLSALSVTWQDTPECWLTSDFISHSFSLGSHDEHPATDGECRERAPKPEQGPE